MRTGFSIAQGRRNTSFCTKIRKALGKKPKKDGRKLRTIKSTTRMNEESEYLFYFLGHLLRTIAPTLFLGISVHFCPRAGHRAIIWELGQQVLKLLRIPSLQLPSRRLKGKVQTVRFGFHSAVICLGSVWHRLGLRGSRLQPRSV